MLAWDTETALVSPGRQAPPLACISWCDGESAGLVDWRDGEELAVELVETTTVGHNVSFDFAVLCVQWPHLLPKVFQAIEEGRVFDTMIRQKLIDIAEGCYRGRRRSDGRWLQYNYGLADLTRRHLNKQLDKDTWRLKYGQLSQRHCDEWPPGARAYAIDDAVHTGLIFDVQEERRLEWLDTRMLDPLHDQVEQMKHAWWIWLMKCWGIRTNMKRVHQLEIETRKVQGELAEHLRAYNLLKPKTRGRGQNKVIVGWTRDTKAAKTRMVEAMGGEQNCQLTKKGDISLTEDACKGSEDVVLRAYAEYTSLGTVISKDIPALRSGQFLPIHSNFNTLLATGRTSSSGPNIQNIRRLPGIREAFVPRKGRVFAGADFDGLELRTLAQTCLELVGYSKLAEALNAGKDAHIILGAQLLGVSYDELDRRIKATKRGEKDDEAKDARQCAKVGNFGLPGGMGLKSFIAYARMGYNVIIDEEKARQIKENWLATWPEMRDYFRLIAEKTDNPEGITDVIQLKSKRVRGKCWYTQACNTNFQGLGADATKAAGWLIVKACYLDKNSPLFGCRIVNYIHDEFILEVPEERGHECAMELARLMVEGASPYLPDVPPTVSEPLLARVWSKNARQVFQDGRLVPWEEAA